MSVARRPNRRSEIREIICFTATPSQHCGKYERKSVMKLLFDVIVTGM